MTEYDLTNKVLDWVDESSEGQISKEAQINYTNFALIIQDSNGTLGYKYPIGSKEDTEKSAESFDKYYLRLLPKHREVAASYINTACYAYGVDPTEKVAEYGGVGNSNRFVSYAEALADLEELKTASNAEKIFRSLDLTIEKSASDEEYIDPDFSAHVLYSLTKILKEDADISSSDPLIQGLHKTASNISDFYLTENQLFETVKEVCEFSNILPEKTEFSNPSEWPRVSIEKKATDNKLEELIEINIHKLEGVVDSGLLQKLASDPVETLSHLPPELVKMIGKALLK